MSLMDKRQNSSTTEQLVVDTSSPGMGVVNELSPIEQLPFPERTYFPTTGDLQASQTLQTGQSASPISVSEVSPSTTQQLSSNTIQLSPIITCALPQVTRTLTDPQTGMLPPLRNTTTLLRQPVVIKATGKKSSGTMRPPPKGRRMIVHVAVTALLAITVLGTLLAVAPTSSEGKSFNPISPIVRYFTSKSDNTALLIQQAATATAVTQDGYDPGANKTFAGVPTAPANYGGSTGTSGGPTSGGGSASDGSGNRFFWGQCTWWAAYRYHALTGHYPPWLGNADAWAYEASAYGWVVSGSPRVPSIIVLGPGVEGAGPYGHVAVVESINADGSVTTSNFNWGVGNFGVETIVTFYPGPGVSFISY